MTIGLLVSRSDETDPEEVTAFHAARMARVGQPSNSREGLLSPPRRITPPMPCYFAHHHLPYTV